MISPVFFVNGRKAGYYFVSPLGWPDAAGFSAGLLRSPKGHKPATFKKPSFESFTM
jgi:hypothetical protein